MKRKIVGVIKVVCFLTLLFICIVGTTKLFQRKASVIKYTSFFEQKEDYDVLFFGSSHVVNGVFPMELWEDYGIVSYNWGTHGSQLATTYWTMQNVFEYTIPKLVVLDIFGVDYQAKYGSAGQIHEAFDIFPMSVTKYKAVQDLFDDENSEDYATRWSYFWDFNVYHSRWNDLKKEDFSYEVNLEKGAESRIDVAVPENYPMISKDEVMQDMDTVGMEYLCRIIEDCQSRGIEVLLTHLPYPCVSDWQKAGNSVYAIAEKYGVNYIDFVGMNNVVDYMTDCYDKASHLNPSGARKVSDYLGNYIVMNYDVPDRRGDVKYAKWHEDFDKYTQLKIENLQAQTELDSYLMLLRDENLNACVYISAESGYLQDPVFHKLLANMSPYGLLSNLAEANVNGNDYMLIVDHTRQTSTGYALNNEVVSVDTSVGQFECLTDKQGNRALLINGENVLVSKPENGKILAKAVVFDSKTGELVSEFTQESEVANQ